MIRPLPWYRVPSLPLRTALQELRWQPEGDLPAASSAAALMLYVALNFMAREEGQESVPIYVVRNASYDILGHVTGLSRRLISCGLKRLEQLNLIASQGSAQRRSYIITGPHDSWFKLPCRAMLEKGVIRPFGTFNLRSKHDLHALKIYIYLASSRDNKSSFAMASYERIHERTGIPERDIRKALSLLISSGLLVNIDREFSRTLKVNEANKYYLAGHMDFFPK